MRESHLSFIFRFLAATAIVFGLVIVALVYGPVIEPPVNSNWTITEAKRDGNNIILRGTVYVERECEYFGPPNGKNPNGDVITITSGSPNQKMRWLAGETYKVGPWTLHNAVGQIVTVYQVHGCHPVWRTITKLGEFDGTNIE